MHVLSSFNFDTNTRKDDIAYGDLEVRAFQHVKDLMDTAIAKKYVQLLQAILMKSGTVEAFQHALDALQV